MRCPKCDHEQGNNKECESCGLIFAKYRKVQERKKAEQVRLLEKQESKSGVGKILLVGLLMVAVAGTTYFLTVENKQNSEVAVTPVPASIESPASTLLPTKTSTDLKPITIQKAPVSAQNAIARASNATVSIETPWGTGSGFFVNDNFIVTNRHVVEFDPEELAKFKHKVETAREMIRLERKKIADLKRQLKTLPKGASRSQLALFIRSREEELARVLPQYEDGERKLSKLEQRVQPSDIKIVTADGSEYQANFLLVSETYDLALMSLFSGDWTYIKRAPSGRGLRQGDKVYTIGSPVGLRQTVTAGIFSGYRKGIETNQVLLQTDAAINPGNSGGPLIDERGYVRGVNTMIIRNTEGIGFAIPIEKVFEEFSNTLF